MRKSAAARVRMGLDTVPQNIRMSMQSVPQSMEARMNLTSEMIPGIATLLCGAVLTFGAGKLCRKLLKYAKK